MLARQEEQDLAHRFAADYEAYRKRVPVFEASFMFRSGEGVFLCRFEWHILELSSPAL